MTDCNNINKNLDDLEAQEKQLLEEIAKEEAELQLIQRKKDKSKRPKTKLKDFEGNDVGIAGQDWWDRVEEDNMLLGSEEVKDLVKEGFEKKQKPIGAKGHMLNYRYDSKGGLFGGADIPASSLVMDLKQLVNSELLSDVTFVVEGQEVPAHKVLCLRCPYFRALLTGDMRESLMDRIAINDVRKDIFLRLLEYLYTDDVEVDLDMAMELFQAADQFGVDRLKRMCESRMLGSIHVENAATIFHAADQHAAASLREKCLAFVLANFDAVTRTQAFEEMGRTNVDLVFEILKARNG